MIAVEPPARLERPPVEGGRVDVGVRRAVRSATGEPGVAPRPLEVTTLVEVHRQEVRHGVDAAGRHLFHDLTGPEVQHLPAAVRQASIGDVPDDRLTEPCRSAGIELDELLQLAAVTPSSTSMPSRRAGCRHTSGLKLRPSTDGVARAAAAGRGSSTSISAAIRASRESGQVVDRAPLAAQPHERVEHERAARRLGSRGAGPRRVAAARGSARRAARAARRRPSGPSCSA